MDQPALSVMDILKIIPLLILLVIVAAGSFLWRNRQKQIRGKCPKCEGKGYWLGTRPGEKEKCDECGGTGRIW
jgi:hypothetical protein